MKIEEFVSALNAGAQLVEVSRDAQVKTVNRTDAEGTVLHLKASMSYRRERDELATLIVEHPDLVARILVRAWRTCDVVDDPLDTDTRLGNTLRSLGAEGGV